MTPVHTERRLSLHWLSLLAIGLLPSLLIDPNTVLNVFVPQRQDSLESAPTIELGNMAPRERRNVVFTLRNRSWRRIQLRPVETDCGCIVVDQSAQELPAGGSVAINVSVVAPESPGGLSRFLLIRSARDEGPAWVVSVIGRVVADVWSEPAQLALELDDRSQASGKLKITHSPGFQIGRVEVESNSVQIHRAEEDGNSVQVTAQVQLPGDGAKAGSDTLTVYRLDEPTRAALKIPIQWRPPATIGYVPQNLSLPHFNSESVGDEHCRRVVAVIVPPNRAGNEVELVPLVPWVRISQRSANGSTLRLELEFERAEMPDKFEQAVLAAHMPGVGSTERLVATGFREGAN